MPTGPGTAAQIAGFKTKLEYDSKTPPAKVAFQDPKWMIEQHELSKAIVRATHSLGLARPGKRFSARPLSELKRTSLENMKARKTHQGKYIILRVVSSVQAWIRQASFVGQEPEGGGTMVQLGGPPFSLVSSDEELSALLPVGSVIALREPTLRQTKGGGPHSICVESPTDVVLLDEAKDLAGLVWKDPAAPKSVMTWAGSTSPTLPSAEHYVGRSAVRLRKGLWRMALQDGQSVLALDKAGNCPAPQRQQGLANTAAAQYALQLWGPAQTSYRQLLAADSTSDVAKDGLERVTKRLHEAKTGEYDFLALYEATQDNPHADLADHVSTAVRVAEIKGKGRGLVANREIEPGDLIMMVKPLASAYFDELGVDMNVGLVNLHNDTIEGSPEGSLDQKLVMRAMDDSSFADVLKLLDAGPAFPPAPNFSLSKLKPKPDVPPSANDIDVSRIEAVRTRNAIRPRRLGPTFTPSGPDDKINGEADARSTMPIALYPPALSLIRHSCKPNCVINFLGDAAFVRPLRFIAENEEIFISRASGLQNGYEARREELKKRGVECTCELCEEDLRDSSLNRIRRRKLYDTHPPPPVSSCDTDIAAWEAYYPRLCERIAEMHKTYSPEHSPFNRYQMARILHLQADVCHDLARASCGCGQSHGASGGPFAKDRSEWARLAIGAVFTLLQCLGGDAPGLDPDICITLDNTYDDHARLISAYLLGASMFHALCQDDRRDLWLEAALDTDRETIGGGRELFELRWRSEMNGYSLPMDLLDPICYG